MQNSAIVGTAAVCTIATDPVKLLGSTFSPELSAYLTGKRIAPTPTERYRPYSSKHAFDPETPTWVQIDLERAMPIESVLLYPASARMYPGRDEFYGGEGFPRRFTIELSEDPNFEQSTKIVDFGNVDFPDPADNITIYKGKNQRGRYVRLTAIALRRVLEMPTEAEWAQGQRCSYSPYYSLMLAKLAVISGGRDVSVGRNVSADAEYGNSKDLLQLTRPERSDGEDVFRNHPELITQPVTWKPVKYSAVTPRDGVALGNGLFRIAMENNINYLLSSYSTADLLRQFYERVGKLKGCNETGSAVFWEEDLGGSNAGRFLMGAGNTIRWISHPELESRMRAVVSGIMECRQPNGYIMGYPEDTIFYSERAAYTRAWLTHGLVEAGYAGDKRAFELLRGYYDWFNKCQFLPLLLRAAPQGGQGMIGNTRVALSPVGRPDDIQVLQRYFLEDRWMEGLAKGEAPDIWQYEYDRPHCYLLTNLEAYLDLYRATGDKRLYDGVLGAWNLYKQNWQQAGGSISIIEFQTDPPKSNYLHQKLGELCGSSFWVFLSQRFQMMNPNDERFATEIEKSIYNIALANQDGGRGLRYHTVLEGKKEKATCHNTCCEGQGTRLIGSLPEHIYSTAEEGLYLHLYEPSSIEWDYKDQHVRLSMETGFPFSNSVKCVVDIPSPVSFDLHIRVPSWARSEMRIDVNGKSAGVGSPGSYKSVSRLWRAGDIVEFALPVGFRVRRYEGGDQIPGRDRYSIEIGPILLAAVGSNRVDLPSGFEPQRIEEYLEAIPGKALHYRLKDSPDVVLMPYWQVSDEEFTCFPSAPSAGAA